MVKIFQEILRRFETLILRRFSPFFAVLRRKDVFSLAKPRVNGNVTLLVVVPGNHRQLVDSGFVGPGYRTLLL